MPEEAEIAVAYTVKELIKGLSDRIDGFMQMMASKADQSTVSQVQLRQDNHEVRIARLELDMENQAKNVTAKSEFRRWAIPAIASIGAVAVTIFQVWHP